MAKHVYLVKIKGGNGNSEHSKFLENMLGLNAKTYARGGINAQCVVSHHETALTIQAVSSFGMKKNRADVTVEEITDSTMNDPKLDHEIYRDLIESLYLPYDTYANIKKKRKTAQR